LNNPLKCIDPSGYETTVTIDGKDYQVVFDGNGKYHLLAGDGGVSASLDLASLLAMIGGYMEQVGDWGEGGDEKTGPVIKFNINDIPVYFLTNEHEKAIEMSKTGQLFTIETGRSFLWWHGGGVNIPYQRYNSDTLGVLIVAAASQYREINWTAIIAGTIVLAIGGYVMIAYFTGWVASGISAVLAGAWIGGGIDIFFGTIAAGLGYKVFMEGIEIATQNAINMPNDFWWPSGPQSNN
jgi:hypothetical protein